MNKSHFLGWFFFILISTANLFSQNSIWEDISDQIPGDSLNNLSDVSIPIRWAAFVSSASNSEIYRIVFPSGSWEILQTPSPVSTFQILYYDQGYICGTDSTVYQTTDAGESWIYIGTPGEYINDIELGYDIYGSNKYICCNNGVIAHITDSGLVVIESGLATNFQKISSLEENKVWIVGDSSIYFFDGNLIIKQFSSPHILNSVLFLNEFYGYVIGDSGYIAQTSDGGNSWMPLENPDTLKRNLNDIYLLGPYGWIVGDDGLIMGTNNSGNIWTIENYWSAERNIKRIHCAGSSIGFGPALAVGENKTALLWPLVLYADNESGSINDYQLYQNYPNPFNPSTIIKYRIQKTSFVTIKLYDVLGNQVATLLSEENPPGDYELEFDGGLLTSGIYFYRMIVGNYTESKKMILLR